MSRRVSPSHSDELHKKQHKRQVGSVTKQLSGLVPTVENISQLNMILRNLPDLLLDYYRRKLSIGREVEIEAAKQFPVAICRVLRVPVENFQDAQEVAKREEIMCLSGDHTYHHPLKQLLLQPRLLTLASVSWFFPNFRGISSRRQSTRLPSPC